MRNLRIQRNEESRSLGEFFGVSLNCALVAKVDFSSGSNKNLQHITYENHTH
jgi:hypothetical protein